MKNIELFVPTEDDLWFREECMSDSDTMSYNAGYDVSYDGYHYDTGCIDFPVDKHKKWFDVKMTDSNFFYAYILDKNTKKFVGYVNFNKKENGKATTGIVIHSRFKGQGYMRPAMNLLIETARKKDVIALTDTVPDNRENALKVFFDLGFIKVGEFKSGKFNKPENILEIEKTL